MTSETAVSSTAGGSCLSVSLVLETGERFDGIPVLSNETSLKDFLDYALKALEVRMLGLRV